MRATIVRFVLTLAGLMVISGAYVRGQQPAAGGNPAWVTAEDLVNGLKDPTRWLSFHGDDSGQRHSPLTQITPQNVNRLAAQWTFQTGIPGKPEATPLLIDGILYFTGPNDTGWAIDARTGREVWRYRRDVVPGVIACCGLVNTGFAALGDRLFKETLDAHLLAISMKTGTIVWDTMLADFKQGYSGTRAPLVVKDKVLVGIAGGEYGIRPFVDAYDSQTGKRAWRWYVTPGPGEAGNETWRGTDKNAWEHGGGATWGTGTYDPELNLVFWGTGNAGPDYDGSEREGDNLYTASLVALDADTGKLRWYYQFAPHDTHDYDANQVPVLGELTIAGQRRKVVMVASRNGFFYTLDRATGKVIVGKPYVYTTWAKEIDKNGRPIMLPGNVPDQEGTVTCPTNGSATNWQSPSFDPAIGLFFVTGSEACATYYAWKTEYKPGESFRGGAPQRVRNQEDRPEYGFLRAIDPLTGERRWEFKFMTSPGGGVLSTASGLLFVGNAQGYFLVFDSKSGKNLWRYQMGAPVGSNAMTYELDGRQYVLISAGMNLTAFSLLDIAS